MYHDDEDDDVVIYVNSNSTMLCVVYVNDDIYTIAL